MLFNECYTRSLLVFSATDKIIQKSRQIVDVKKEDGFAALHLAALNGHRDVTNTLLSMVDIPKSIFLHASSFYNHKIAYFPTGYLLF